MDKELLRRYINRAKYVVFLSQFPSQSCVLTNTPSDPDNTTHTHKKSEPILLQLLRVPIRNSPSEPFNLHLDSSFCDLCGQKDTQDCCLGHFDLTTSRCRFPPKPLQSIHLIQHFQP